MSLKVRVSTQNGEEEDYNAVTYFKQRLDGTAHGESADQVPAQVENLSLSLSILLASLVKRDVLSLEDVKALLPYDSQVRSITLIK